MKSPILPLLFAVLLFIAMMISLEIGPLVGVRRRSEPEGSG